MLTVINAFSQEFAHGIFEGQSDIGNVKIQGTVSYDQQEDEYVIGGSGENIWFTEDEFHYVWKTMEGDFILYAKIEFMGDNLEPHRKVGWMIRQSLDDNAPYVDVAVHGDGLTSLQYRQEIEGETAEIKAEITAPDIIQLERKGNTYIMSAAKKGEPLKLLAVHEQKLSYSVYAGLFICSHNEHNFQQATFNNVRITVPAAPENEDSREGVKSRLEFIDIDSYNRVNLNTFDHLIEAPNWSEVEPVLIYNSGGNLYRYPVDGGEPVKINTGNLNNLNNDHGISPDSKWIAISNNDPDVGSRIYVIPYEGGEPQLVTENVPSYWHGWSSDSKHVAYVARRGDETSFNIYRNRRKGGREEKLNASDCLDDGPDYSPDGEYIYFNSCRSGTMQIWRMKPDGSEAEQLTFDEYQDWFPHPSPDGKWIVFISYPEEVPPASHPPNKNVMLRMMPADGGDIKIITHLYGGQGTINVPSWSPDSKKIGFVSYTY